MPNYVYPEPEDTVVPSTNFRIPFNQLTSIVPGVEVPILFMDILPKDRISFDMEGIIESFPMIAPSIGAWEVRLKAFIEPLENLYGWMDNNDRMTPERFINEPRHTYSFGLQDSDSSYSISLDILSLKSSIVAPASLYQYEGIPAGWFGEPFVEGTGQDVTSGFSPREFPADYRLAYYDIVRNYVTNPQEPSQPFVSFKRPDYNTPLQTQIFGVDDINTFYRLLRLLPVGTNLSTYDWNNLASLGATGSVISFARFLFGDKHSDTQYMQPFGGLALSTYKMDMMRGIMNADVGSFKSTVSVDNGNFSIDTLRFANKLQKMIDKFDISGGRFTDWMRGIWSVAPNIRTDVPIFLGSVSTRIYNTDVVATSAGQSEQDAPVSGSVLGQQAGFVSGHGKKSRRIIVNSNGYGVLVVLASVVPIVRYSQGIDIRMRKTKFADVYQPDFSQIGFQDVPREELSAIPYGNLIVPSDKTKLPYMSFTPNNSLSNRVFGKRIAWTEYMTEISRAYGSFAVGESLDYWSFGRAFSRSLPAPTNLSSEQLKGYDALMLRYGPFSSSTYVHPAHWQYFFNNTRADAENMRLIVDFNMECRRPLPKRIMPKL